MKFFVPREIAIVGVERRGRCPGHTGLAEVLYQRNIGLVPVAIRVEDPAPVGRDAQLVHAEDIIFRHSPEPQALRAPARREREELDCRAALGVPIENIDAGCRHCPKPPPILF